MALPGDEHLEGRIDQHLDHYGPVSPWQAGRQEGYGAIPELDQLPEIGESSGSGYYDYGGRGGYGNGSAQNQYYGGHSNQIDTGYRGGGGSNYYGGGYSGNRGYGSLGELPELDQITSSGYSSHHLYDD